MLMELVGGAVESSCLEKVVQHGSSEDKQEGPGQGKQEQQEMFGPTVMMREAALRITALSQLGMSRTVLITQCCQSCCNPVAFSLPKILSGGAGQPDRSAINQPAASRAKGHRLREMPGPLNCSHNMPAAPLQAFPWATGGQAQCPRRRDKCRTQPGSPSARQVVPPCGSSPHCSVMTWAVRVSGGSERELKINQSINKSIISQSPPQKLKRL